MEPLFVTEGGTTPLKDCLHLLPWLPIQTDGRIDYPAADPDLLLRLTHCATAGSQGIQLGIASIGRLLVHIAPEIGLGEVPAEAMESLGWLLAELGDVAAALMVLSAACRRHIIDYQPDTVRRPPNVRF